MPIDSVGAPLTISIGTIQVPEDMAPFHRALDRPDGDMIEIWKNPEAIWIRYGLLSAKLLSDQIVASIAVTEPLLERVLLPIHRMFCLKDAVGFHGSAICNERGAFVLIGPTRAGKSSTAHALTDHGWRLAADDVALVNSQGLLLPAPPAVRLLSGSHGPDKHRMDLPFEKAQVQPTPLTGFVALLRDGKTRQLSGAEALQTLLEASFVVTNPLPVWNQARFRRISELARQVPVHAFGVPTSETGTPDHAAALSEWLDAW